MTTIPLCGQKKDIMISFPHKQSIALLLDPDKSFEKLDETLKVAVDSGIDYIMVGGSLTFNKVDLLITKIKKRCSIPVVLFPGNLLQLDLQADIILLLSLISGRNPELLIGNHVIAAPYLKKVKEKTFPIGYILIGCGTKTSVEYISQTESIPMEKEDIAVATALAGELLGLKAIYLEAGSGADKHVPLTTIKSIKENIDIPIIVGGGIKTGQEITDLYGAGADMVVIGNSCEKNPGFIAEACEAKKHII